MECKINGVAVKVGQTWRQRDGDTEIIASFDDHKTYPINGKSGQSYTREGFSWASLAEHDSDLISLLSEAPAEPDQDGWYTPDAPAEPNPDGWDGMETLPVQAEPEDYETQVAKVDGKFVAQWRYRNRPEQPAGVTAEEKAAITEMQQAALTPLSAFDLLGQAAGHMKDRAATYDKPQGERSMAATVAAFNAQTGRDLTEDEGWLFMVNLKIVRDRQRDQPHRDSIEDLIAYGSLYGEARLNNGGAQ